METGRSSQWMPATIWLSTMAVAQEAAPCRRFILTLTDPMTFPISLTVMVSQALACLTMAGFRMAVRQPLLLGLAISGIAGARRNFAKR